MKKTKLTPKRRVLRRYPYAYAVAAMLGGCKIMSNPDDLVVLAHCATARQAWRAAADNHCR